MNIYIWFLTDVWKQKRQILNDSSVSIYINAGPWYQEKHWFSLKQMKDTFQD